MIDQKRIAAVTSQIARILREEREQRGLSMNTVSERSGLSQPMVSLVERELRNPTIDTLLRLAVALELDLSDVLQRAQRAAARPKTK
ncbi:MAG: helix-turn-helix transcriptional regulator [Opitutaceae bacterium]|nr:helix-turn-helix transcriptional regulator [Opitutaceae bacterium]